MLELHHNQVGAVVPQLGDAYGGKTERPKNRDHNLRRADLVWLDGVEGMEWAMDRIIDLVRTSNRDRFDFGLRKFAENPQVALYEAADEGHFTWHSDIGDGPMARKRKLTFVAQHSKPETYDGGDLEVMPGAHSLSSNRAQGCVTFFPSFHLHQATSVTRGRRHLLMVWTHGPTFH